MTNPLPLDFFSRARQILLPLVNDWDDRDVLINDSFYLVDARLYARISAQINLSSNPKPFTTHLIKVCHDAECIREGLHPLGQLLMTAKILADADEEQEAEIDALVQVTAQLCADSRPKAPAPSDDPAADAPPPTVQTVDTPVDERTPTIFISYSHKDTDFAKRLIADLQAAGHACWIDTVKIKGGDEWVRSIVEGINNSYAFISVVSANANASTWVKRELLWAEYREKKIFPAMAKPCEIPITMIERQVLDLHSDYAAGLAALLETLPAPSRPVMDRAASLSDAFALFGEEGESSFEDDLAEPPRPASRRRLELDYLEQLRAEVLFDLEKYTPLGGESQFMRQVQRGESLELAHMRPEFEHLRYERGAMQSERRTFDNAVDEMLAIRRAVLLGEPGAGKTTTLLSLAGRLADAAEDDPDAPLPLFVRLGRWTDADQTLPDFIAEELGPLGAHLERLIAQDRVVPLLDGMNEIPVGQRTAKYRQIAHFIVSQPEWIAVASCREQDYSDELQMDRISVTPLDPLRIREFVVRYLGAEQGAMLFWKIAGGEELKSVWETWQRAGADFNLFWTAQDIPRQNPDVYGVTSSAEDRIWREKVRDASSMLQLARNPYMLTMLTQVFVARGDLPPNRGELFRDFVETLLVREDLATRDNLTRAVVVGDEGRGLLAALEELAYSMQIQRANAGDEDADGNALTVLELADVRKFLDERQLYLAGSTSILDIGDDVRFTHQLLQEYFAAQHLKQLIFAPLTRGERPGVRQASDIWPPERWWVRTNWEEAVILLAGLYSDDCTPVVDWVNAANPEVAALCVTRSGAQLAEATRDRLRAEWIPRLTDIENDPDPRARAAVGRALGLTNWDNRKGVALTSEFPLPEREGTYQLPDVDWVPIPAGEFLYGEDKEPMTLPAFEISRYPITYAQFQAFLDAPDGYGSTTHDWFAGLAASDRDRQMKEQEFQYWNHPRETVNWYQAIAFCRWWSWRLAALTPGPPEFDMMNPATWAVRLPTEFEWERAARGTHGRTYPWGDEFDATKLNSSVDGAIRLGQTSAVGIYPQGASPDGVMEMSGNVWEWCLTDFDNPDEEINNQKIGSNVRRVLRGGSWYGNVEGYFRCGFRDGDNPRYRNFNYGFRVVRS